MIGIYVRVSTSGQDTASQERELKVWSAAQTEPVAIYRDKATGLKMARPGMDKLLSDVRRGQIKRIVVWRLDRLGRTAKGLLEFFEELNLLGCGFLSLRDSIDLATPTGRLTVLILAGVAQFETEVRSERQRAGINAARERNGGRCPWGGRKLGQAVKVTPEKAAAIRTLDAAGRSVKEIAEVTGLGRQTIYRVLGRWERKPSKATRSHQDQSEGVGQWSGPPERA